VGEDTKGQRDLLEVLRTSHGSDGARSGPDIHNDGVLNPRNLQVNTLIVNDIANTLETIENKSAFSRTDYKEIQNANGELRALTSIGNKMKNRRHT
jgi:hypothetical protein